MLQVNQLYFTEPIETYYAKNILIRVSYGKKSQFYRRIEMLILRAVKMAETGSLHSPVSFILSRNGRFR